MSGTTGLGISGAFAPQPLLDLREARRAYMRSYQLRWMNRRREAWLAENGPCVRCGSTNRLEVDHRDPTKKVTHLIWSFSKERLEAELAKCQVLCHDCHLRKTAFDVFPLNEAQVADLVERVAAGEKKAAVARDYGITRNTLYRILDGDVPWLRTYPRPERLRR